jgi:hypothetical protein
MFPLRSSCKQEQRSTVFFYQFSISAAFWLTAHIPIFASMLQEFVLALIPSCFPSHLNKYLLPYLTPSPSLYYSSAFHSLSSSLPHTHTHTHNLSLAFSLSIPFSLVSEGHSITNIPWGQSCLSGTPSWFCVKVLHFFSGLVLFDVFLQFCKL